MPQGGGGQSLGGDLGQAFGWWLGCNNFQSIRLGLVEEYFQ